MDTKTKIKYLSLMEAAFRMPPETGKSNSLGLCYYCCNQLEMSEEDIQELLGDKYGTTRYSFGHDGRSGSTQFYLYRSGEPGCQYENPDLYAKRFDRANWCKEERERLQGKQYHRCDVATDADDQCYSDADSGL